MIVKNDGFSLVSALGLVPGSLKHVGNYLFLAVKGDRAVMIQAERCGDDLRVLHVNSGSSYETSSEYTAQDIVNQFVDGDITYDDAVELLELVNG